MPKIKCREYLSGLQNLTKGEIPLTEIARNFIISGISKQQDEKKLANSISNRIYNDGYFSDDEVKILDKVYKSNEILLPIDNISTIRLDYYPDVFGSCGNGVFQFSTKREEITVPKNVILKNPNFRKAEELWNFIQAFESQDKKEKEKREFFDKGILKNEYDQAFLMAFIANKNFISSSQATTETNIINQMIQRLVENLLDTDPDLTEDKIQDAFLKQIKIIKERNENRSKRIYGVLEDRLEREEKSLNDVLNHLRKEA